MGSKELDNFLRFVTSDDRTEGSLRIEPGFDPEALEADAVYAFIDAKAINRSYVDGDAIEQLVEQAGADSEATHEAVVARGEAAQQGRDGGFVWQEQVKTQLDELDKRIAAAKCLEETGASPDEADDDNGVDFYAQSAFIVVRRGQKLGELVEPTEGVDGVDIFGNSVTARDGKKTDFKLDRSLTCDEQGAVYAAISGVLETTRSSAKICDVLHVHGFVDFSCGNIDFPGPVVIDKGVRDRFVVRSEKDVHIRELVEAAEVHAAGDLVLDGGMAGRERGMLRIGGNLTARYLDGVDAIVGRDCEIAKEITNCTLVVGKHLEAPNAAIRGGRLHLAGASDVGQLGSEQGVETVVSLGDIPELSRLLQTATELIPEIKQRVADTQEKFDSLSNMVRKPTGAQAEQLTELQFDVCNTQTLLDRVQEGVQAVTALVRDHTNVQLIVRKCIYAGTVIHLPRWRVEFSRDVKGPATLSTADSGTALIHLPGADRPSPLSEVATISRDDSVVWLKDVLGDAPAFDADVPLDDNVAA